MDAPKKLTPYECRLEHHNVLNDPKHPMFEPYKRADPMALRYIEAVYASAFGKATVEIGEGIEIHHKL
jgi:hypothetical protein